MLEVFPETRRMWRFGGMRPIVAFVMTMRAFKRNGLDARSAHAAYYGMLIIPPLLILLIAAAAHLPIDGVLESVEGGTQAALPEGASELVIDQVEEIRQSRSPELFWLAAGVVVFAGARLFNVLGRGMNTAFWVRETRPFWKVWGISLVLCVAAFLLLLIASTLLVLGPRIAAFMETQADARRLGFLLSDGVRFAIVAVAALLATATLYWALPNVKRPWLFLTPGNVLAVAAWFAFALGFKAYVDRFGRYNETYGALAGVVLLMIWLYLTGLTFFFGAQLESVLMRAAGPPSARGGEQPEA